MPFLCLVGRSFMKDLNSEFNSLFMHKETDESTQVSDITLWQIINEEKPTPLWWR